MTTEFKIITRQVSNQNKAKFPNINPPFFQKKYSKRIELQRIESVENTDETFIFPEDFDGKTYFRDCYGIERNTAKSPEHIVLRAYEDKAAYIRTLPLHSSQKEIATTTEFSDFELYVRPTFDFCQEILSHGGDIEILSPQSLRTIIYDEARRMVRKYAGK